MLGEKWIHRQHIHMTHHNVQIYDNKHSNIYVGVYCDDFVIYHNSWSI